MNSFRRRRKRKEGAAGNNNGGRGARAGRAALGAARPAVPAGSSRFGSAQRWAGNPRRRRRPPCPAGSPARPRAAPAGGSPGLSAALPAPLGFILRGSEGPNRRQPPLAEDEATPPRWGGASCRLFNPFQEAGGVGGGASASGRFHKAKGGWAKDGEGGNVRFRAGETWPEGKLCTQQQSISPLS